MRLKQKIFPSADLEWLPNLSNLTTSLVLSSLAIPEYRPVPPTWTVFVAQASNVQSAFRNALAPVGGCNESACIATSGGLAMQHTHSRVLCSRQQPIFPRLTASFCVLLETEASTARLCTACHVRQPRVSNLSDPKPCPGRPARSRTEDPPSSPSPPPHFAWPQSL